MSSKKYLKFKNKRLRAKLVKLNTQMTLLRSDILIDRESLSYRVIFAESQVRSIIRENAALREQLIILTPKIVEGSNVRNEGETQFLPQISNVSFPNGITNNIPDPPNNTEVS